MSKSRDDSNELVELTGVESLIEAEKIRLLLEAEGISAVVKQKGPGQYIQIVTGVVDRDLGVFVNQQDIQRAIAIMVEAPKLELEGEMDFDDTYEKAFKKKRVVFFWIVIGLLIVIPILSMMLTGVFNTIV